VVAPGLADLAFGRWPPGVAGRGEFIGCELRLVPGLADLTLGGWPPSVVAAGGFVGGLGVGDGGQAGQVYGRQGGPDDKGAGASAHVILQSVSWRCVGGQLADRRPTLATSVPAATSYGQFAAGAGAACDRHRPAANGRPAGDVR
jgi:hypothetical protein